jgi:HEAT repeat protein
VIGHYEVDLKHPARDREKGRIWRVVYRGPDGKGAPQPVTNLAKADVDTLVKTLAHTNLAVRLQATQQLVERGGAAAVTALAPIAKDVAIGGNGAQKAHTLWVLERLGKLDDATLDAAASAKEKAVRVHAQRILTEKKSWSPKYATLAKQGVADKDPFVQRVAVEALAAHPAADQISTLLAARQRVSEKDNHLIYAIRLALRAQFADPSAWQSIEKAKLSVEDARTIADVCLAIRDEKAARFLRSFLQGHDDGIERTKTLLHHVVRYGGDGTAAWVVDYIGKKHVANVNSQGLLLKAFVQATQERGGKLELKDRTMVEQLVTTLIASPKSADKQLGADLAGSFKLVKAQPQLLAMVGQANLSEAVRKQCVTTLVNLDGKQAIPPLSEILLSEKEPIAVREQIANALAATNRAEAHAALVQALQNAPARLQTTIALGMAGGVQGGDRLLQAIEAGKASPRLLQDPAISVRLSSAKIANVKNRLKKLTQGMPAADQKTQALIAKKRDAFASFKADPAAGQKIFQKTCGVCHQIATQGAKVGPQLDGIGVRGIERLLEDVLDPNRNVDQAFRTTQIVTKENRDERRQDAHRPFLARGRQPCHSWQ